MKKTVLIIGAGGVAQVVAHKCAQNNDVLGDLHIASRTKAKCDAIIESVHAKGAMKVDGAFEAHAVDATQSAEVAELMGIEPEPSAEQKQEPHAKAQRR